KGWWGDNPPFHHSVFVLTSHPCEPLEMQGGTTFHFVTYGIESALEQARAAAGEKECLSGAGRPSRSSTSQRVCSTRSSSRSSRSCSEAALDCSKTWEMRSSSRSSRSRRPA